MTPRVHLPETFRFPPGSTLAIRAWQDTFEVSESRKIQSLQWYPCPAGCESHGFRKLSRMGADGFAAMGVFSALCQAYAASAKRKVRDGLFIRSCGSSMSLDDLADLIRCDCELFERLVAILCSPDIQWLAVLLPDCPDVSGSHPDVPGYNPDASGSHPGTLLPCWENSPPKGEEKRREEKKDLSLLKGISPREESGTILNNERARENERERENHSVPACQIQPDSSEIAADPWDQFERRTNLSRADLIRFMATLHGTAKAFTAESLADAYLRVAASRNLHTWAANGAGRPIGPLNVRADAENFVHMSAAKNPDGHQLVRRSRKSPKPLTPEARKYLADHGIDPDKPPQAWDTADHATLNAYLREHQP